MLFMLRLDVRRVEQIKNRHDLYIYLGSRAVDGKRLLECQLESRYLCRFFDSRYLYRFLNSWYLMYIPVIKEPIQVPGIEEPTKVPGIQEPTQVPKIKEPTLVPGIQEPTQVHGIELAFNSRNLLTSTALDPLFVTFVNLVIILVAIPHSVPIKNPEVCKNC